MELSGLDLAIIAVYLAAETSIGLVLTRRAAGRLAGCAEQRMRMIDRNLERTESAR